MTCCVDDHRCGRFAATGSTRKLSGIWLLQSGMRYVFDCLTSNRAVLTGNGSLEKVRQGNRFLFIMNVFDLSHAVIDRIIFSTSGENYCGVNIH